MRKIESKGERNRERINRKMYSEKDKQKDPKIKAVNKERYRDKKAGWKRERQRDTKTIRDK